MKTLIRSCALMATACLVACTDSGGGEGLLARAGAHEFTVDEAVRLLAGQPDLANEPQVAAALAELWVDYTLLASALAADTTLSDLDMEALIRGPIEQDMILALRDSVIQVDTVVSEAELREQFELEAPGARVRARHILFGFPPQATSAQRDSVREQAEAVLQRVRGGESFEELARQFSQDPGSAANGGDLGFFGRTDMVEPFAVAAFALEPGGVSDVVESPYGYHIIRSEEKETPSIEDVTPEMEQRLRAQRSQQAESLYVTGIEEGAGIKARDNIGDVVRSMIINPDVALSRRARERVLVDFKGGSLTVGDLRTFMQTQTPEGRARLVDAPDSVLVDNLLRGLTQRKLLVAEARSLGLEPTQEYRDSLKHTVRAQLRDAARALDLLPVVPEGTETMAQAIDRTVETVLRGIVSNTRDVIPLGPVSTALRESASVQIFDAAANAVVSGVAAVRGPAPPPPAPSLPTSAPGGTGGAPGADTAGG